MALIDKASLLFVPSVVAQEKAFNILPSGNRAPDSTDQNSGYDNTRADFTFDRGSNAAATRIGSDGLIKKYRENLLLQSNSFNTTWANSGTITRTSGHSGYDGSNDAWLLTKGSAGAFIRQTNSQSGVRTFSVYAKADTADWLLLDIDGSPDAFQYFDLGNGVLGATGTNIDARITSVGNGWYRCSVTGADTYTEVRIYPAEGNNNVSGTTTQLYIQSAQLESGLVSTDVLTSGATTAKAGVLIDLPRINYDANGENGALLLEPSRANKFSFSEYASGNHLVGSPTITQNYAVSPDGGKNAFRIQDTTGSTFKRIGQSSGGLSVSANSTYTQSLFVKKATSSVSSYGGVGFDYSGSTRQISYIIFDEYNGTMTALQSQSTLTLHDAEDYGDYWRFSISAEDTGSNTNLSINVYACLSSNGTGVSTGTKDWTGYGLQLEAGSYVSSYIPNMGESGGVTRAADLATGAGTSSTFNDSEGVLYAEISALADDGTYRILSINDGTRNERVYVQYTNASNTIAVVVKNGNTTQANISHTLTDETKNAKVAFKYKANDFALYVNGSQIGTDTSGSTPVGLNNFSFDQGNGANFFYGNVKQVAVFNEALSDSELATLTTL